MFSRTIKEVMFMNNNGNNRDYPEASFQLGGFSDDPVKRKQELEELRDFLNNEISARHNQHTDTNYDDEYICVEANPEDSVEEEELN